ncbi:ImmA/IrrE family metallo-endopeptidase [Phycicoccus sp. Soil748]|uniref:ImmA/IrrE family metallo-endopeptidase n=1 Tax=Phycicoccus sp. Soil748 TaxID=1736397 RepID=UPI000A40EDD8|nr:ImmA/IrrE family metallo-endopeptidase [Phycicoccus sp. Soil748]
MSGSPLLGMTVGQIREKARADAARVLRETWGSPPAVPVQPVNIARALGLGVFSAELGDDAWGMLIGSSAGVDIYLDRDQPTNRFRFSCAHEIGHFVHRDADIEADQAFVDKRSDAGHGRADEIFANEFAASLLMPEAHFVSAVRAGEDNYDLAQRFDVSLQAVQLRRHHLNL